MNKNNILLALTIISFIYICFTVGGTPNLFSLWNVSPIILCYFILKNALKDKNIFSHWSSIIFSLTTVSSILYIHTAWWQDWDKMKTGSSTSALIFIFLPIYAIILGGITGFLAWFTALIIKNKT